MNLKLQLREEPEKGLNEPGGYPVWVPSGYSLARFIRPVSHPLTPSCLMLLPLSLSLLFCVLHSDTSILMLGLFL